MAGTEVFWNKRLSRHSGKYTIDPIAYARAGSLTRQDFLRRVSDVQGKRVLEIGCGRGDLTVYLAKCGAYVTATDFSEVAVEKTSSLAAYNGVADRVTTQRVGALDLQNLDSRFDLVAGKFILHHIEPFSDFVKVLLSLLDDGGKAVFMENNARNPLLMFARQRFAGRYGIPKYGDSDEHPLKPQEISLLRGHFARVDVIFPEFTFFRQLNTYLFRQNSRFSWLMEFNNLLDSSIYKSMPGLHKYGYLQILEISHPYRGDGAPS